MKRRMRQFCVGVAGLCVAVGLQRAGRAVRQELLNRQLIRALHANDSQTALMVLADGADANARDVPAEQRFLAQMVAGLFRDEARAAVPVHAPTALLVAIDWRWRENRAHFSSYTPANAPRQDTAVIRALLEHGADVDIKNEAGLTPLQVAAWEGNSSTVRLLLEHGAARNIDVHDRRDQTDTPLLYAVSAESIPAAKVLLQYHADINTIRGVDKCTALELARAWGNRAMVKVLEDALKARSLQ